MRQEHDPALRWIWRADVYVGRKNGLASTKSFQVVRLPEVRQ